MTRMICVLTALAISSAAWAAAPTPILSVGDSVDGVTVDNIAGVSINQVGGYAVGLSDAGGAEYIVGAADGGAVSILVQYGTFGTLDIDDLLPNSFGIANDGTVVWRGEEDATGTIAIGLSDGTLIAVEDQPIPSLGGTYNVPNGPNITAGTNQVSFRASYVPAGGAVSSGSAIFTDNGNSTVLVKDADSLDGDLIDTSVSDFGISPSGANTVTAATVASGFDNDRVLAVNGAAASSFGTVIREDNIVPAGAGGNGADKWDNFSSSTFAANDSGSYLFTGALETGNTDDDHFLAIDGVIVMRESNSLGSGVITDGVASAALNNDGDWAAIWEVDQNEVLIVNGEILTQVGDLTSEGVALWNLGSSSNQLMITPRTGDAFDVLFTGDDANGEAVYRITVPEPISATLLGLGGLMLLGRRR